MTVAIGVLASSWTGCAWAVAEAGGTMATDKQGGAGARGISSSEMRFDVWRRRVGLYAGPALLALLWVAPLPLETDAHRLAAIMGLVSLWWITEAVPLPVTALFGTALTVLTGVSAANAAFAPFANPIIFLFVGSFIIGRAVAVHGLDLRIAQSLLTSKFVDGRVTRVPLVLGLLCVGVSGWVSGTATTAMMMPLALGVLSAMRAQGLEPGPTFGNRTMLTIAFAASIGSKVTPVGAASNMVALGFLESLGGVRIEFVTWMIMGIPLTIVMAIILMAMMRWLMPHSQADLAARVSREAAASHDGREAPNLGPLTVAQRNCLLVFVGTAIFWLMPGVLRLLSDSPAVETLAQRLNLGVVALTGASLLFILPAGAPDRRFTLTWKEAVQIDWGTILLFGGGLSLGQMMFATGLAEAIGRGLIVVSGAETLWGVTAMALAAAIALTNLTSNTATAAMLTPVVLSIAAASGLNPIPPALAVAFGCGVPYMLPISTPPNAIVYGSGMVPIVSMIKLGFVMSIAGFICMFGLLRVMLPLLGFA